MSRSYPAHETASLGLARGRCASVGAQWWISAALIGVVATLLQGTAVGQCRSWDPRIGATGLDTEALVMLTQQGPHGPVLWVGGYFDGYGGRVARWNGSSWSGAGSLGVLGNSVHAFAVFDSGAGPRICAGGDFHLTVPPSGACHGVAEWNGGNWGPLDQGLNGDVFDLAVLSLPTGTTLIAGGRFTSTLTGAVPCQRVARWNGSAWSQVGTSTAFPGANSDVYAVEVFDSGAGPELYIGGNFSNVDGVTTGCVAKWDGVSWSAVGLGTQPAGAGLLIVHDDGAGRALYASDGRNLKKYDGSIWVDLGAAPTDLGGSVPGRINGFASLDDGDGPALYVGGVFSAIGGIAADNLARHDALGWHSVGGGTNSLFPSYPGNVFALGVFEAGSYSELVVTGKFLSVGAIPSNYIAAWRGCAAPIDSLCFGDGTVGDCTCNNQGALGNGCRNGSSAAGARMSASGDPTLDTVVLTVVNEPPSAATLVVQADADLDEVRLFGDGLFCLDGRLVRLFTKTASSGSVVVPGVGDPSIRTRSAGRGDPLSSGDVRYYQSIYRDAHASFCPAGGTSNTSNAIRIVW